jgi:hypothetical protein
MREDLFDQNEAFTITNGELLFQGIRIDTNAYTVYTSILSARPGWLKSTRTTVIHEIYIMNGTPYLHSPIHDPQVNIRR